jgi:hypothetical protein
MAPGQTGNGAKFWPDDSANKAYVAGVRMDKIFHFRPLFLWFISFGGAKEMNKNIDKESNIMAKSVSSQTPACYRSF